MYTGTYSFGPGPANSMEVGVGRDGLLNIKRGPEGVSRRLFYLGNHEFHPTGAQAVRIRFDVTAERASALTVADPNPTLIARHEAF